MKTPVLIVAAIASFALACQGQCAEAYKSEHVTLSAGGHALTLQTARTLQPPSQPVRYSIRNLFDNNRATAWVTRFTDDPVVLEEGYFVIEFDKPVYVKSLYIRNGYQKSDALYQENERVKQLYVDRVIVGGPSFPMGHMFKLPDSQAEQKISLTDNWTKTINLFKTKQLIVSVTDIYKGSKYQDLCISGLRIDYQESSGYRPTVSWQALKEQIGKNATKSDGSWYWRGLNAHGYQLFTDFLYYVLSGDAEAKRLFATYRPIATDQSEAMSSIYRPAIAASQGPGIPNQNR